MSKKMTRAEAVALVGEKAVDQVESKNCEPTNRVGFNGACQGDSSTEWSASVPCSVGEDEGHLIAVYYTTPEQDEAMGAAGGDGSAINWTIDHYVFT